MGSRVGIARHRADTKTNSIAVIAKAVSENAGGVGRQAAVIAAASGLVLTTGIAANAAEPTVGQRESAPTTLNIATAPAVTASAAVQIAFESPTVSSAPAPVKVKQTVAPQSNTASKAPAAATQAAPAAPAPSQAAPANVAASGAGAVVVASALAQLGVTQDCTALVRTALRSAGLPTTPMGPSAFASLGRVISAAEAQPGDVAYYSNNGYGGQHVAIYIGNGQAVHGGWLGNQTVVASVNIPTGPPDYYIAIGR